MPGKANPETDESAVTLWWEHHLSHTHAVLWTVILVATVGDILLTMTGLTVGLQEGNVVVSRMLAEFGLAGFWLVKFGAMLWLVAGWRLLSEYNATVFLALFAVVTLAVVAYNAVTILQYRGVITAVAVF
ncbi:hypothetical protein EGO51_05325 [Haloarcula hispanica]|uniref:DUF5658 domain-containing protein n=1 Tax=Haloarcula hispanica TaxID=51589 RepID=A0A5J5LH25_HALHI|nr:DUF5658 family protein [Haloarcula hispanica]KAA9409237.1 hypothetical protein EGO51_05325 [Haloarcula hispanica]